MSLLLEVFAVAASMLMGVSIGASTVSTAFGPVNGARSANVLRSALLAGLMAFLGALIQGGSVTETVSKGVVAGGLNPLQGGTVLFIAGVLVLVSVLKDYPMPTAFTVIGSVLGIGIGFGAEIEWAMVLRVVGYWLFIPLASVIMGYLAAKVFRKYMDREDDERKIKWLLLISGCYVSFSAGASAVGLAVGPLAGLGVKTVFLLILGGLAILLGAWMYSPRIIRAVSFDYSNIGPRRSLAALLTAGTLAQIGIFFGIPISFNEAIIASVIGSGLVEGKSNTDSKKIFRTVAAWVGAFFLAILLAFAVGLPFR
ncbi:MAG: anion permease [Candidatus Nanohalobium sp.]